MVRISLNNRFIVLRDSSKYNLSETQKSSVDDQLATISAIQTDLESATNTTYEAIKTADKRVNQIGHDIVGMLTAQQRAGAPRSESQLQNIFVQMDSIFARINTTLRELANRGVAVPPQIIADFDRAKKGTAQIHVILHAKPTG